jgi:hypothetical protein
LIDRVLERGMVDKWMAEVWTQDSWLSEKEVRLKGGIIF